MPAVGMRRSTRVFGLVMKGADSGRVLRSGRRLWPENSVEAKAKRVLMTRQQREKRGRDGVDRRFGIVYSRKRRRVQGSSSEPSRRKWLVFEFVGFGVGVHRGGRSDIRGALFLFLYEPINGAFASRGVQFLQILYASMVYPLSIPVICLATLVLVMNERMETGNYGPPTANIGICQFFGITQFMPLFCVDFAAVILFVHNPITIHSDVEDDEMEIDFPEHQNKLQISCNVLKREPSENGTVTPDVAEINDNLSSHSSVKCTRVAGRNGQYRNIMNSRGIRKRRSSLRKRKARNPSTMSFTQKNLTIGSPTGNLKEASSTIANSAGGLDGGLDSSVCSANILITESDQCYRVEGAIVTLEMPTLRECLLAVKKDGLTRCSFKAEKLEFSNRQDWTVFKDLYKECSDRNILLPVAKFIPVPGVREVSSYAECNSFPFHRPDTYISAYGDELTRAMTRKTTNYDMDSEDEEWLRKFNNEFQEHVSEDNFELIIDALEKFCYCKSDDSFDEKSAVTGCQDLGGKEVSHQAKRAPLIPKPLLRKRRSFKRQPSQFSRSNQPSVLKAMAAEQDALEENAMLRIEEAKPQQTYIHGISHEKRKRAQFLAENADLATYKATMLIKIAEAAMASEAVDCRRRILS
ncbi:Enhancer of polycomb-like, N-terminal [Sesbania bispinosa]|nr:Enhancer of polycomb-like, N-terminal [Sesbania bispinosa]